MILCSLKMLQMPSHSTDSKILMKGMEWLYLADSLKLSI